MKDISAQQEHFTIGINATVPRNIFHYLKKRKSKDISAQFHLSLFIREMLKTKTIF